MKQSSLTPPQLTPHTLHQPTIHTSTYHPHHHYHKSCQAPKPSVCLTSNASIDIPTSSKIAYGKRGIAPSRHKEVELAVRLDIDASHTRRDLDLDPVPCAWVGWALTIDVWKVWRLGDGDVLLMYCLGLWDDGFDGVGLQCEALMSLSQVGARAKLVGRFNRMLRVTRDEGKGLSVQRRWLSRGASCWDLGYCH